MLNWQKGLLGPLAFAFLTLESSLLLSRAAFVVCGEAFLLLASPPRRERDQQTLTLSRLTAQRLRGDDNR